MQNKFKGTELITQYPLLFFAFTSARAARLSAQPRHGKTEC